MGKGPFKMKGFPAHAGVSPVKKERHSDKFARVKEETDASENKAEVLSANYGGTWTMGTDKAGNKLWLNEEGQNVKEAAISQSPAGGN